MKNIDLEKFYQKIDKSILLVSAFIGNKILENIIRSCRLKPYSLFSETMGQRTNLERHWVDEYGNSLTIDDTKIKIVLNDLTIEKNTEISTDLFWGRNITYFVDTGKKVYICDDIISMYGEDEYLRSFVFEERWVSISPLILGMNNLENIFSDKNVLILPRCRGAVIEQINSLQKENKFAKG